MPITDSHCRELIDNVVDMAHFSYVHFSFPTSFRNVFEGTRATQFMESQGRPDVSGGYGDADLFLKSEATYYGGGRSGLPAAEVAENLARRAEEERASVVEPAETR